MHKTKISPTKMHPCWYFFLIFTFNVGQQADGKHSSNIWSCSVCSQRLIWTVCFYWLNNNQPLRLSPSVQIYCVYCCTGLVFFCFLTLWISPTRQTSPSLLSVSPLSWSPPTWQKTCQRTSSWRVLQASYGRPWTPWVSPATPAAACPTRSRSEIWQTAAWALTNRRLLQHLNLSPLFPVIPQDMALTILLPDWLRMSSVLIRKLRHLVIVSKYERGARREKEKHGDKEE